MVTAGIIMYSIKTEGIVIKSYDYGEGHRIIIIFTKDYGKIRAVAKGSRKTKSKFGAVLEPLSQNNFMFHRKPAGELFTITGYKSINSHRKIRENMLLYGYGSIMTEGIDLLLSDEDPEEYLYDLFVQALFDAEQYYASSSCWLFMFRLLKYTGYRLNMFTCAVCGKAEIRNMCFSIENGGIICRSCRHNERLNWKVSRETLTGIRKLSVENSLTDNVEKEIGNIIKKYIKYQFNKELKSMRFLKLFRKKDKIKPVRVIMPAVS